MTTTTVLALHIKQIALAPGKVLVAQLRCVGQCRRVAPGQPSTPYLHVGVLFFLVMLVRLREALNGVQHADRQLCGGIVETGAEGEDASQPCRTPANSVTRCHSTI